MFCFLFFTFLSHIFSLSPISQVDSNLYEVKQYFSQKTRTLLLSDYFKEAHNDPKKIQLMKSKILIKIDEHLNNIEIYPNRFLITHGDFKITLDSQNEIIQIEGIDWLNQQELPPQTSTEQYIFFQRYNWIALIELLGVKTKDIHLTDISLENLKNCFQYIKQAGYDHPAILNEQGLFFESQPTQYPYEWELPSSNLLFISFDLNPPHDNENLKKFTIESKKVVSITVSNLFAHYIQYPKMQKLSSVYTNSEFLQNKALQVSLQYLEMLKTVRHFNIDLKSLNENNLVIDPSNNILMINTTFGHIPFDEDLNCPFFIKKMINKLLNSSGYKLEHIKTIDELIDNFTKILDLWNNEGVYHEVEEEIKDDGSLESQIRIIQKGRSLGKDIYTDEKFVIKKVSENEYQKWNSYTQLPNAHNHIVPLLGAIQNDDGSYWTLSPYFGSDLELLLEIKPNYLDDPQMIQHFLKNILHHLDFLHKNNISHGDLHLANFIVSESLELKIIDWGSGGLDSNNLVIVIFLNKLLQQKFGLQLYSLETLFKSLENPKVKEYFEKLNLLRLIGALNVQTLSQIDAMTLCPLLETDRPPLAPPSFTLTQSSKKSHRFNKTFKTPRPLIRLKSYSQIQKHA